MISGEFEMKEIEERTKELEKKINIYEDIKYQALARTQCTMLICFTLIFITMIISFFIWAGLPDDKEKVEMQAENGMNNYIGERGDITNGVHED